MGCGIDIFGLGQRFRHLTTDALVDGTCRITHLTRSTERGRDKALCSEGAMFDD